MSIKKLIGSIKMKIPAGKATPAPPVGPSLGQYGLNLIEFCKDFNSRTAKYKEGISLITHINIYENKSFDVFIYMPEVTYFLKKCIENTILEEKLRNYISVRQIYEIALVKITDSHLKNIPIKSLCKMIIGTANSMSIKIVP